MKKLATLLLFSSSLLILSCKQKKGSNANDSANVKSKIGAGFTMMETLKGSMKVNLIEALKQKPIFDAKSYFISQHGNEILKTLEIADTSYIPGIDMYMVFYRYSIGSDILRETIYMKQIDGRWFTYYKYFASYDEDPFGNGLGNEGKKLLEKSEAWEKANRAVWWY